MPGHLGHLAPAFSPEFLLYSAPKKPLPYRQGLFAFIHYFITGLGVGNLGFIPTPFYEFEAFMRYSQRHRLFRFLE